MPMDPNSPYIGKDGAPTHKAYSRATIIHANGHIKPGFDGDPPTQFYTSDDYVKVAELADMVDALGLDVAAQDLRYGFVWEGGLTTAAESARVHNAITEGTCGFAIAWPVIPPTNGPISLQFEYKGANVLTSPLVIPQNADPYDWVVTATFAIDDFLASSALDFFRPLTAKCVSANAADVDCVVQQEIYLARKTS